MSLSFTFIAPQKTVVGWGAATDGRLAAEAKALGQRPLIVCGNSLKASGALDAILVSLHSAGLAPSVHVGVPPEPTLDDCNRAIDAAAGCDSILAIGGGSALDVAKTAALAPCGVSVHDLFHGRAAVPETGGLPIVAAPTTSGTGSEATWVGVFTDRAANRKASFRGGAMMPAVVVLDAQLTVSCPRGVTAHSGMDAFVQAVESYLSVGANPLTMPIALSAAFDLADALPAAFADGTDQKAREAMLLGSYMAGVALNTSRLGLVHGLAHPVGVRTGAAHGLVCAVLLAPVLRYNADAVPDRIQDIGLGLDAPDGDLAGYADQLLADLGLPTRLSEIGVKEADLDAIATESLSSGSAKANPQPVTFDGALDVLRACF